MPPSGIVFGWQITGCVAGSVRGWSARLRLRGRWGAWRRHAITGLLAASLVTQLGDFALALSDDVLYSLNMLSDTDEVEADTFGALRQFAVRPEDFTSARKEC